MALWRAPLRRDRTAIDRTEGAPRAPRLLTRLTAAIAAPALVAAAVLSAVLLPAAPAEAATWSGGPTCSPGYVYSVQGTGQVYQVDGTGAVSTSNGWASLGYASVNGLGIAANGSAIYAYNRAGTSSQNIGTMLQWTSAGGWAAVPNSSYSTGMTSALVAGAVDLGNGMYDFGGFTYTGGQWQFWLFQWSPSTGAFTKLGYVDTGITSSSAVNNGDMAFDSAGNLYIVRSGNPTGTSGNDTTNIYTVMASSLAAASGGQLAAASTNPGTTITNVNGIAFEADGTVYLGNGTSGSPASTLAHYDPTDWSTVGPDGGVVTNQLAASSDLASCNSPASLTIQKNVAGRAAASDQFTMTLTTSGGSQIATATTAGSATGVQPQQIGPVPAVAGSTYAFSEAMAAGSASSLTAYTSTWQCTATSPYTLSTSGTGTSGSVTIPALISGQPGATVTCAFTNTPRSNTVTLTKAWVGAVAGDKAALRIGGPGVVGAVGNISTAGSGANPDTGHQATATAYDGTAVTLGETVTSASGAVYTPTYACTQGTVPVPVSSGTFTMPAAAGEVDCTVTNTAQVNAVTLTKQWVNAWAGDTAALSIGGSGVSGAVGATSTADGSSPQLDTGHEATAAAVGGTTVRLTETVTAPSGAVYTPTYACTQGSSPIAVTDAAFTMPAAGGAVDCVVTNAATPASVRVDKVWTVRDQDGTVVGTFHVPSQAGDTAAGLPPGFAATPTIDGEGLGWGVVADGFAVGQSLTLGESGVTVPAGCAVTGSSVTEVDGAAPPSTGALPYTTTVAAQPQPNTFTITNAVTCTQTLTLVKRVAFGSAAPTDWTLSGSGPKGALPGPSGTTGSSGATASVTPEVAYALAETGGPDTYVAVDGWACVDGGASVSAPGGAVVVGYGENVTCTITNETAEITLLKHIVGGGLTADEFRLSLTPVGGGGLASHTQIVGSETPTAGNTFEVFPSARYALAESPVRSGVAYRSLGLQVSTDGTTWTAVTSGADVSVPAGAHVFYRFVNEAVTAAVDPPAGTVDPPAGTMAETGSNVMPALGAAAALLGAGGVLIGWLWLRRRRLG